MISSLSTCEGPWVLASENEFSTEWVPPGFFVARVDGNVQLSLDAVYDSFVSELSFPGYFGRNFNALHDCLTDLEWLSAPGYVIVLKNFGHVSACMSFDLLTGLLDVLNDVGKEWSVKQEEAYTPGRTAILFKTVVEMTSFRDDSSAMVMREYITSLGNQ